MGTTDRKKALRLSRTIAIILVLVSVLFLVVFTVLISIGVINASKYFSFVNEGPSSSNKFQYRMVNPTLNETSFGFVNQYDELAEDEFLSYEDSNGNYILVSNFGNNEYFCTGTCSCSGDNEKRRNTGTVTFIHRDECVRQLSESCTSPDSIQSEVDDCQEMGKADVPTTTSVDEIDWYWCEGHCMLTDKLVHPIAMEAADIFDCTQFDTSNEIDLTPIEGESLEESIERARMEFIRTDLTRFCYEIGEGRYFLDDEDDEEDILEMWDRFCVGSLDKGGVVTNPTVACRKRDKNRIHW